MLWWHTLFPFLKYFNFCSCATIPTHWEIQCLPYAGGSSLYLFYYWQSIGCSAVSSMQYFVGIFLLFFLLSNCFALYQLFSLLICILGLKRVQIKPNIWLTKTSFYCFLNPWIVNKVMLCIPKENRPCADLRYWGKTVLVLVQKFVQP